jgi:hypothetical protein
MLAWVFLLAVLGVTMAIPMKRQIINIEQLRFPSGIAAAETLHALQSTGSTGMRSAKALGWAALLAATGKLWADGLAVLTIQVDGGSRHVEHAFTRSEDREFDQSARRVTASRPKLETFRRDDRRLSLYSQDDESGAVLAERAGDSGPEVLGTRREVAVIIRLLTGTITALLVVSLFGRAATVDAVEPAAGAVDAVCGDPFERTELFFGSAKPDGSVVTDGEFATFIEEEVTPRFPDGLTLLVGSGQFKNGAAVIVRERSFVLILLHPRPNPESSADVEAIRRAYKARFAQHSVLRIDSQITRVCF